MTLNLTQAAEMMALAKEKFWKEAMTNKNKPSSGMDWKSYEHGIIWQMDYYGNHRLIQAEGPSFKVGEWAMYTSPAILGEFMIFTSYFTSLEEKLLQYKAL